MTTTVSVVPRFYMVCLCEEAKLYRVINIIWFPLQTLDEFSQLMRNAGVTHHDILCTTSLLIVLWSILGPMFCHHLFLHTSQKSQILVRFTKSLINFPNFFYIWSWHGISGDYLSSWFKYMSINSHQGVSGVNLPSLCSCSINKGKSLAFRFKSRQYQVSYLEHTFEKLHSPFTASIE